MKDILVSVIISVYNADNYLTSCIESVIAQTIFDKVELILVNDLSTDGSAKIINNYASAYSNIKAIHLKQNLGPYGAANEGAKKAKGVYIARIDSDDIMVPDRLRKQVNFLENNKDYALVSSNALFINNQNQIFHITKMPTSPAQITANMYFRNPIVHSSILLRKSAFNFISGYSPLRKAQDYDLYAKLIRYGFKLYGLKEPLVLRRLHTENITAKDNAASNENSEQEKLARQILKEFHQDHLQITPTNEEIKMLRKVVFANDKRLSIMQKYKLMTYFRKHRLRLRKKYGANSETVIYAEDLIFRELYAEMFQTKVEKVLRKLISLKFKLTNNYEIN